MSTAASNHRVGVQRSYSMTHYLNPRPHMHVLFPNYIIAFYASHPLVELFRNTWLGQKLYSNHSEYAAAR